MHRLGRRKPRGLSKGSRTYESRGGSPNCEIYHKRSGKSGLVIRGRAVLVILDGDKHSTLAVLHDAHDHPDDFPLLSLLHSRSLLSSPLLSLPSPIPPEWRLSPPMPCTTRSNPRALPTNCLPTSIPARSTTSRHGPDTPAMDPRTARSPQHRLPTRSSTRMVQWPRCNTTPTNISPDPLPIITTRIPSHTLTFPHHRMATRYKVLTAA